ncbi:hypothetical protein ACVWZL_005617 [Bradyrhizobium sp. GM2.4]
MKKTLVAALTVATIAGSLVTATPSAPRPMTGSASASQPA